MIEIYEAMGLKCPTLAQCTPSVIVQETPPPEDEYQKVQNIEFTFLGWLRKDHKYMSKVSHREDIVIVPRKPEEMNAREYLYSLLQTPSPKI